jgi:hypothetical protein
MPMALTARQPWFRQRVTGIGKWLTYSCARAPTQPFETLRGNFQSSEQLKTDTMISQDFFRIARRGRVTEQPNGPSGPLKTRPLNSQDVRPLAAAGPSM